MAVALKRPLSYGLPPPGPVPSGPAYQLCIAGRENNREHVVQQLWQCPVLKGRNTMVGLGGFAFLNVASVHGTGAFFSERQIEHVVLVDHRPIAVRFWMSEIAPLMKQPGVTRRDVIKKIKQIVLNDHSFYFPAPSWFAKRAAAKSGEPASLENARYDYRAFKTEVEWNWNWLGTNEKFERIAKLFRENRFHFIGLDISNTSAVKQFLENMQVNDMQIETLEDSARPYLHTQEQREGYCDSMELLMASNPYIISVTSDDPEWGVLSMRAELHLPEPEAREPAEASESKGLTVAVPTDGAPPIQVLSTDSFI